MNWATIVGKITGSVDGHLLRCNEYLLAENRVLRSRLNKRLQFTDNERLTLARAAKPLGRALLADIASIASPNTLLRWHRELVEGKPSKHGKPTTGRPPTDDPIVELVLRFAKENPSWGYGRIVGTLKELGHELSDTTVGNILRENAQPTAPERSKSKSWKQFVNEHKDALVACDCFSKEIWTMAGLGHV